MADTALAPIIIKRIKKGGHGHHGGAWKVAYADFVTAMMAFFLLLWLLNVTTPEQKRGIADYFTPTIGIKDSKGIGFKGGKMAGPKGVSTQNMTAPGIVIGQVRQGAAPKAPDDTNAKVITNNEAPTAPENSTAPATAKPSEEDAQNNKEVKEDEDSNQFKTTSEDVKQALEQDPDLQAFKNNVVVQDTPEGLKIDLIDDPKRSMFIPGGATLTDAGKKVLDSMASIVSKTPNQISILGHTDASGATTNPQYTNWELSADRANAARRALITTQIEPERVAKVVGLADHDLLTPQEPASPRNRRITIVLMRGAYFRDAKSQPATRALLTVSDAKVKKEEPSAPAAPAEPAKPAGPSIFDQATPLSPAGQ
jgi:chemotaxis protein MotB